MSFKQTWWNDNIPTRMSEFTSWVGSENAQSKVYFRKFVKNGKYKSLIDVGCGTATEYFAYKKEYPELEYLGVDSCVPLHDKNKELGVPILLADADNIPLEDNSAEVVFARHVLEHQPSFYPVLNEMIRLSKILVCHIFFITPKYDSEVISYDPKENLYHNQFSRQSIEDVLHHNPKVSTFFWRPINNDETALIIYLK